jgi:ABC-type uncharacterized transport system permease subunit
MSYLITAGIGFLALAALLTAAWIIVTAAMAARGLWE